VTRQAKAWAFRTSGILIALVAILAGVGHAFGSTYVVYIPLDSPIYHELETLNSLGYIESYLDEIKPISRMEAARLTIEAERQYQTASEKGAPDIDLAQQVIAALKRELREEIGWLNNNQEDDLPNLIHPLQRIETQYIYSHGPVFSEHTPPGKAPQINFDEATPLLPNNNALPTSEGGNEVLRATNWLGFGSFFTLYGEGAIAGPMTRGVSEPAGSAESRFQMLDAEAVVSLGNTAISFGQEEMWWGGGYFGALSQSNNASPFPAVRVQNIHPIHLPWIFKYLGLFRYQLFFGQLDDNRVFRSPWIDGQIFSFRPLPYFEFGLDHAIQFGGYGNDHYNWMGFLGRASGFATGNPVDGNTNSRAGVYLKAYIRQWRNLQLYFEILGEDNLTKEVPVVGRILPFLARSFQLGAYLPRLTSDGLTDLRIESVILEPNYSVHSDSLYWTQHDRLMGDWLGPNASEVDVQFGRWLNLEYKTDLDFFWTQRATDFAYNYVHETGEGVAVDLWSLPMKLPSTGGTLGSVQARTAFEHISHLNFSNEGAFRALFLLSFQLNPGWNSIQW
jgi:hypothetical protein